MYKIAQVMQKSLLNFSELASDQLCQVDWLDSAVEVSRQESQDEAFSELASDQLCLCKVDCFILMYSNKFATSATGIICGFEC